MIAALLAAALVVSPIAHSRDVIAAVQIHGNHVTSDAEILRISGLAVGAPFEATTVADVETRLRASGLFDDVDVLKRFASIADPSQIVVVIIVNEGPVRLDFSGPSDEPIRVVRRRGLRNLMYLPILDAEDGYGLTYGVRLALVKFAGPQSRLSFPLSWGGLKQAGVEFDRPFARGPLTRVQVGVAVQRQRNPAFDEQDDRRRLWARAERRWGSLRGAVTGGWQHVSFAATDDDLKTVGGEVTFDTRLTPLLPRNALYASAGAERVGFGSGGATTRTRLDGRGYLGLVGQTVLEVRVARSDASEPLPPYLRNLLGGWSSLRGFEAGAFTGDTVVTGSAELRVPITSTLSVGKVGVSVFVDSGAAYDKGQRFGDAVLRTGIGGSVWFVATVFHMNLSVAHGRGADTRVNFGGGFVF
ncbi:MAG: BamA/TamA family outer membrane protein [Vicinamibacterales bacterium]